MKKFIVIILANLMLLSCIQGQDKKSATQRTALQVNGVFPHLTILGASEKGRSESGIGALVPWADKLWMIGYVAHIRGTGMGLYAISEDMTMEKHPQSITGTFANRMIHNPSNQAIIGPHFINGQGRVRTSSELGKHRLAATMEHLTDHENKVYFLTMEGLFLNVMCTALR